MSDKLKIMQEKLTGSDDDIEDNNIIPVPQEPDKERDSKPLDSVRQKARAS